MRGRTREHPTVKTRTKRARFPMARPYSTQISWLLFEIGPHHADQLFGRAPDFSVRLQCRIDEMHADVIFDHLSHQAVDRPPRAGDELQDVGTADFLLERPFDGLD